MYSLEEVKMRGLRDNSKDNNRIMFFATKFSIYFSWFFINIGLSANAVTFLFFITGLIGSFFVFSSELVCIMISYVLYRLHIIFDVCDGEVARFNKTFSLNGAYWDYMIHALLYPLYFFGITYSSYIKFDEPFFLILGCAGILVISLMLAVKNNYFRAMFFNNKDFNEWKNINKKVSNQSFTLFNLASLLLGFEGFFALYIPVNIFGNEYLLITFIICYIFLFSLSVAIKFLGFSKKGYYVSRS